MQVTEQRGFGAFVPADGAQHKHGEPKAETQERNFKIGEWVRLQAHELHDTIITLWRFGLTIMQAIEDYRRSLGIQFLPSPRET